jgi:hypothetical protein
MRSARGKGRCWMSGCCKMNLCSLPTSRRIIRYSGDRTRERSNTSNYSRRWRTDDLSLSVQRQSGKRIISSVNTVYTLDGFLFTFFVQVLILMAYLIANPDSPRVISHNPLIPCTILFQQFFSLDSNDFVRRLIDDFSGSRLVNLSLPVGMSELSFLTLSTKQLDPPLNEEPQTWSFLLPDAICRFLGSSCKSETRSLE